MVDEDVKRLLDLRIRRISVYDIERNRKEIADVDQKLAEIASKLEHLTRTAMDYIQSLIDRFGEHFPRRTHVERFDQIDKKAVANQGIRLQYDKDTGFFGTSVKGVGFELNVSEFDLVLAISDDGTYRIMPPPDKTLLPGKVLYCEVFDPDAGFEATVVYRDRAKHAYGKRVHIQKFVRSREYQLIKDKMGKVDLLVDPSEAGTLTLSFVPAPRQRSKSAKFDLQTLEKTGVAAKGIRLAPKPVRSMKHAAPKAKTARKRKPRKPGGGAGGGTQQSLL
jgi:topoisomerase-4 subunit A